MVHDQELDSLGVYIAACLGISLTLERMIDLPRRPDPRDNVPSLGRNREPS
jgi:hypothetical protein